METVINSAHIKQDMVSSLDKLLAEVGIIENSETSIERKKVLIAEYKTQNEELISKAESLTKFGFINTPTVKNRKIIEQKIKEINGEIEILYNEIEKRNKLTSAVDKYAIKFPGFKFIPTHIMTQIMKKYNLVLSDTCIYKQEIPYRALELAENFKYHIEQKEFFFDISHSPSVVDPEEQVLIGFKMRSCDMYLNKERECDYIQSNLKIIAPEDHFEIPLIKDRAENIPLFILDEETRRLELNSTKIEHIIMENTKVLDPILALEVDEGFIVIHAWDEEANIPEIRNEVLN